MVKEVTNKMLCVTSTLIVFSKRLVRHVNQIQKLMKDSKIRPKIMENPVF